MKFEVLNDEELDLFLNYFDRKKIKKGQIIIKEGDIEDSAFILLKGKIELSKKTLNNEDYVVAIIDESKDTIFGEISLVDQGPRTSTVKALEDCEILVIPNKKFKQFVDTYKEIGIKMLWRLLKSCAGHLRKSDEDIIHLFNALEEVIKDD